ncbi:hypothetical protein [Amycolatopsis sp. TNS106]|uniref:hypothetical protein n=1 Tax=Amycolatopsis sp. TNS106 TaxID=2861750 RepID=UPI001C581DF8|nr:hypothetical protein [Amycolatopsis sp. TNS106]QXV57439.1 hypothetical protein CVV72_10850 [Amycolatopsis sp. TNS106]
MTRDSSGPLGRTPSTDELLDVDTSFLDAYRRGGTEELKRMRAQPQRPGTLMVVGTGSDGSSRDLGTGGGSDRAASMGSLGSTDPGTAPDSTALGTSPSLRPDDTALAPRPRSDEALPPPEPRQVPDSTKAASLQYTDHQDAVQNGTTSTKGGTTGSGENATLPQSGFRLSGVKSQPSVRALPSVVVSTLREHLRSAAVRELGATDRVARAFTERLSQASLVTAFLLAQLDLRLDVDAATRAAAELFRSHDPLLGAVAARLATLEELEVERAARWGDIRAELGELRQIISVVEQTSAYLIADRTENFLRGSHDLRDAPITHGSAIFVRDKAREAVQEQTRLERVREGRPIR